MSVYILINYIFLYLAQFLIATLYLYYENICNKPLNDVNILLTCIADASSLQKLFKIINLLLNIF